MFIFHGNKTDSLLEVSIKLYVTDFSKHNSHWVSYFVSQHFPSIVYNYVQTEFLILFHSIPRVLFTITYIEKASLFPVYHLQIA